MSLYYVIRVLLNLFSLICGSVDGEGGGGSCDDGGSGGNCNSGGGGGSCDGGGGGGNGICDTSAGVVLVCAGSFCCAANIFWKICNWAFNSKFSAIVASTLVAQSVLSKKKKHISF